MRFFDYNKCKEVKNMNEIYYTIGEVSKLTNISIKALRYYDKINLFKPAYVDPVTNYRYYTDSQLYHLDFIKSLKYIGIPLEEMKKAQDLKADGLLAFITKQEQLVQKKLNDLYSHTEFSWHLRIARVSKVDIESRLVIIPTIIGLS